MKFRESRGLDYKDVLLVPKYSDIESRKEVDISSTLSEDINLKIPVISANMDTITNELVAKEMSLNGAAGILHRYQSSEETFASLKFLAQHNSFAIPSIGVGIAALDQAHYYCEYPSMDAICIDIAHGDSELMLQTIEQLRKITIVDIIAGNIATPEAAIRMIEAGADIIKVGIGPGFVCTTRKETGAGYPQLSAIIEIAEVVHARNKTLIADGGIRDVGDIVKALAAGADAVMSGFLFAGSKESGKETYRGMASLEAQQSFKGSAKNIEGRTTNIETKGSIKDILQLIKDGIQSGLSYCGARNLTELRNNAEFVIIH